jgi:cysteine-S-conjugate beta-lyase
MTYDFDQIIDRRATESVKWNRYGEDVLPLWVADMDFRSPEPVIRALRERIDHGILGYPQEVPGLREAFLAHLERDHAWQVDPEALVLLPGVVTGFNLAIHAFTAAGDGVLAQTPVYYPILRAPGTAGRLLDQMQLTLRPNGRYEVDFELFEATITPRTRIFILCNPHNPVGRVFGPDELERMAEICLRHDVVICSDEIHCDLIFPGHRHTPIASLHPDIARRTITLMAPSKTYNIAGLHCSVAIIEDKDLREQYCAARAGLVPWVGVMGQLAGLAAYRDGGPWLEAVLGYLAGNCDFLQSYVETDLPGITMIHPEGTYLAWLDCRAADLGRNPYEFFLEEARVALNDGGSFGRGGEGFVRLNFGCPRSTLESALERMRRALLARG